MLVAMLVFLDRLGRHINRSSRENKQVNCLATIGGAEVRGNLIGGPVVFFMADNPRRAAHFSTGT
jgi:hypothetical protein